MAQNGEPFFIGGYGESIYASRLHSDGSMDEPVAVGSLVRPNFFARHPEQELLYAVGNASPAEKGAPGVVAAFRWDKKKLNELQPGALTLVNQQPIPLDTACHISVDPQAEFVVVANYGKGSIVVYPLESTGAIGPMLQRLEHSGKGKDPSRQSSPHAHCSIWTASGSHLLVADLGMDKVLVYEVDRSTRHLKPCPDLDLTLAPGAGPRHLAFDPTERILYVINELDMSISSFNWHGNRPSTAIETVTTLPQGVSDPSYSTAEILVHPSGQFVYGSNRGHDSIASFQIDRSTGKLTPTGHTPTLGKTPRNFRLSPGGQFLLAENQQSNNIVSFRIDPEKGTLRPTGFLIEAPAPACIKFLK